MAVYEDAEFKRLAGDAESLALFRQLNELFAIAFDEVETYSKHKPQDDYLMSLLSKSHIIICVATVGPQVVGGLAAYVLEKFEQERNEVYIYDLAVGNDYRRKKIATKLIHFLKGEASQAGAWVVFVQADPEDMPAVKLYESLGSREDVFHFDIKLERHDH